MDVKAFGAIGNTFVKLGGRKRIVYLSALLSIPCGKEEVLRHSRSLTERKMEKWWR